MVLADSALACGFALVVMACGSEVGLRLILAQMRRQAYVKLLQGCRPCIEKRSQEAEIHNFICTMLANWVTLAKRNRGKQLLGLAAK